MSKLERMEKAIKRLLITAQQHNAGYYISSDTYYILKEALVEESNNA